MKTLYVRPVQLRGLIFLGFLLLALVILGSMVWRNLHNFERVLSYVSYSHRIQNVSVGLQQAVIEYLTEKSQAHPPAAMTKMLAEMDLLQKDSRYLSTTTKENLDTVRLLLANVENFKKREKHDRLIEVLKVMIKTLETEGLQREKLLEDISLETQSELYLTLVAFVLILLGAILFFHRRILHPLHDLTQLLDQLTEEKYAPIETDHLDPLLLPVFQSYNEMVTHLAELEETKRRYAQSLQQDVRLAIQALLEQQSNLARAERLAAIGEVAAELAHEIRNPLAGIQIAFSNLRREIDNPDQCERMDLIGNELKRLARLLSDMLDQSRHLPENASDFDVKQLIRDLAVLTRYQIPQQIQLQVDSDASALWVHLPESGLRQALLNLILNSACALEKQAGSILIKTLQRRHDLTVQIIDNGPGFSKEMLNYGIRLFRTSSHRGTGLGLAMVQRFAKDVGGAIELSNQQPQGACVSLSLPNCIVASSV
jgi:nitrogen fixation/metabolism regulation signal transduction histidine kinase